MKLSPLILPSVVPLFVATGIAYGINRCADAPATPIVFPTAPSERHATASHQHNFTVNLPFANTFAMFEPVGEKLWVEGWDPVFASSGNTGLHDGSVFTTKVDGSGTTSRSVWLVTLHDHAAGALDYRVVTPGQHVQSISIRCRTVRESLTSVKVTCVYTGLSDDGDRYIGAMTDEQFRTTIEKWAGAIRAYLARGTPASP